MCLLDVWLFLYLRWSATVSISTNFDPKSKSDDSNAPSELLVFLTGTPDLTTLQQNCCNQGLDILWPWRLVGPADSYDWNPSTRYQPPAQDIDRWPRRSVETTDSPDRRPWPATIPQTRGGRTWPGRRLGRGPAFFALFSRSRSVEDARYIYLNFMLLKELEIFEQVTFGNTTFYSIWFIM